MTLKGKNVLFRTVYVIHMYIYIYMLYTFFNVKWMRPYRYCFSTLLLRRISPLKSTEDFFHNLPSSSPLCVCSFGILWSLKREKNRNTSLDLPWKSPLITKPSPKPCWPFFLVYSLFLPSKNIHNYFLPHGYSRFENVQIGLSNQHECNRIRTLCKHVNSIKFHRLFPFPVTDCYYGFFTCTLKKRFVSNNR